MRRRKFEIAQPLWTKLFWQVKLTCQLIDDQLGYKPLTTLAHHCRQWCVNPFISNGTSTLEDASIKGAHVSPGKINARLIFVIYYLSRVRQGHFSLSRGCPFNGGVAVHILCDVFWQRFLTAALRFTNDFDSDKWWIWIKSYNYCDICGIFYHIASSNIGPCTREPGTGYLCIYPCLTITDQVKASRAHLKGRGQYMVYFSEIPEEVAWRQVKY